jgi:hypothetical protein
MGLKTSLDIVERRKIPSLHWELNPGTLIVQPVAGQVFTIIMSHGFL